MNVSQFLDLPETDTPVEIVGIKKPPAKSRIWSGAGRRHLLENVSDLLPGDAEDPGARRFDSAITPQLSSWS
jgi:hypothetical protein